MPETPEQTIAKLEAQIKMITEDRNRWQKRCNDAVAARDELQETVTQMIMEKVKEAAR